MKTYKGILVGKGSALSEALESRSDTSEADAKKVYEETGKRFELLHGKEDATWFLAKAREFYNKHKEYSC